MYITKLFQTKLYCEHCKDIEMVYTGRNFLTNPMKYEHECPKCYRTVICVGIIYPQIKYKPVNNS